MTSLNYLWWQQEENWLNEINNRKKFQLIYHLQELVLIDYFQKSACSRILEFGCGFGRHLSYLKDIPNLEVFGYDQSHSMVSSMKTWAQTDWIDEHIKVGNPEDSLPYPDSYFDIVFTTSVLIHILPEDAKSVLKELVRVAKYQVIHLEPAPTFDVNFSSHNGCWNHDLVGLYKSMDCRCEVLKPAFEAQRIYRVLLDEDKLDHTYVPSDLFLDKLFSLEQDIQSTIYKLLQERDGLAQQYNSLSLERDGLAQQCNEIIDSRTWKLIQLIKNSYFLKKLGHITLDLIQNPRANIKAKTRILDNSAKQNLTSSVIYDRDMECWLQSFKERNKSVLAIYISTWLGISSATKNMFEDCHAIPEHLSENQARYYAKLFSDHGVNHLIIAGVSNGNLELIKNVKSLYPKIRCDVTWHGNFLQNSEDFGWSMLNQAIELAKQGKIYKLGFAKKGMEKTFSSLGLRSEFLPNFVDKISLSSAIVNPVRPQLGIWLSGMTYLKIPYAMIAAVNLVEDAVLNMSGVGDRAKEWADMLGIEVNYYSPSPIPREELHRRIQNTHLSLYLTSAECAPMLPIESLSLGVPCLISPVSHWFEDDEYLHSRLVVPYPERPEVIAQYIQQALLEREKIIEQYKIYAVRYNQYAKEQVQKFLGN